MYSFKYYKYERDKWSIKTRDGRKTKESGLKVHFMYYFLENPIFAYSRPFYISVTQNENSRVTKYLCGIRTTEIIYKRNSKKLIYTDVHKQITI